MSSPPIFSVCVKVRAMGGSREKKKRASCINLYYKQVPSAYLSAKHIYNISGIHQKGVCVCVCVWPHRGNLFV